MRCINALDGFCHGFDFIRVDNRFQLFADGVDFLASLSHDDFVAMRKSGQASADNVVIRLGAFGGDKAGNKKIEHETEFHNVAVLRAELAFVDGKLEFSPEVDSDSGDLLLLFRTDHLRYQNSGLAALDGAEILGRSQLADGQQEVILARMAPGSALRGYIDNHTVNTGAPQRQYISNFALSSDGRELIAHG